MTPLEPLFDFDDPAERGKIFCLEFKSRWHKFSKKRLPVPKSVQKTGCACERLERFELNFSIRV
jgi:hypothetical protein